MNKNGLKNTGFKRYYEKHDRSTQNTGGRR